MRTKYKDYYAILGVTVSATLADIKRAYRRLAKQYHPDVNHNDDAAERFRELTEAYDTLVDPEKRRRYDQLHGMHTGNASNGTGGSRARNTSSGSRARTGNGSSDIGSQAGSRILRVLEDIWLEIRRRHPDIPSAVIIIASGTEGKHPRWGHYDPDRWHVAGENRAEIMISGEGLRRVPRDVLGTLLHEAAHALAAAQGIQDTSRQGRYHNIRFAQLARELGLDVAQTPKTGWSTTTVPDHTATIYAAQIRALQEAMTLWRQSETPARPKERRSNGFIAAICPCGRTIRAAASTLADAPITCQGCDGTFEPKAS